MGYRSRGLRGSTFEELINRTNDVYRRCHLALIQKIPTSITPVAFDAKSKQITLAYFEQRSTVDYMGAIQGIPVCFDAKETSLKNLPLQNIHDHQVEFMMDFEKQGGISFLLVYFSVFDEYYVLDLETMTTYWQEAKRGGRKSIPYKAFDKRLEIFWHATYGIHYLEGVQTLLSK